MNEYFNTKRVNYNGAQFIPRCHCGRIVKADKTIDVNGLGEWVKKPNATCKKHGRIEMIFEGYF